MLLLIGVCDGSHNGGDRVTARAKVADRCVAHLANQRLARSFARLDDTKGAARLREQEEHVGRRRARVLEPGGERGLGCAGDVVEQRRLLGDARRDVGQMGPALGEVDDVVENRCESSTRCGSAEEITAMAEPLIRFII